MVASVFLPPVEERHNLRPGAVCARGEPPRAGAAGDTPLRGPLDRVIVVRAGSHIRKAFRCGFRRLGFWLLGFRLAEGGIYRGPGTGYRKGILSLSGPGRRDRLPVRIGDAQRLCNGFTVLSGVC